MPHFETMTLTMLWITSLGNWKFVVPLAILVSILCWLSRKRKTITPFIIALIGTEITVELLKILIRRPRPIGASFLETSYSFPSGHAAISVALYGFIAFLLWKRSKSQLKRGMILAVALLLMLFIGFSRVYLGVHFPTDVLGGYMVGAAWLWVAIRSVR
jgi:membrane-associated phospholipid phosphatase